MQFSASLTVIVGHIGSLAQSSKFFGRLVTLLELFGASGIKSSVGQFIDADEPDSFASVWRPNIGSGNNLPETSKPDFGQV